MTFLARSVNLLNIRAPFRRFRLFRHFRLFRRVRRTEWTELTESTDRRLVVHPELGADEFGALGVTFSRSERLAFQLLQVRRLRKQKQLIDRLAAHSISAGGGSAAG